MHAPISAQTSCAEAGQLDQSLALHEAALDSLSHGLFMLDAELRLVLYNSRYLEMYGLTPDEVRVGMSFVDMLRLLAGHGSISDEQIEEHHRKRREMMARGEPFRLVRQIPDGRTYLLNSRPVAGIICVSPRALETETALGLNSDSWRAKAATRNGSRLFCRANRSRSSRNGIGNASFQNSAGAESMRMYK